MSMPQGREFRRRESRKKRAERASWTSAGEEWVRLKIDPPFRPSTAVARGLDPRVHLLRIAFAKMMDARVKPAHDDRVDQIERPAFCLLRLLRRFDPHLLRDCGDD